MKKRTLNEYRQTKEYKLKKLDEEITKVFSPQKLNDAAKAKLHEFKDVEFDDLEDTKEEKLKKLEEAHKIPEEIKEITLKQQMQELSLIHI